jgi:hypothetical protein
MGYQYIPFPARGGELGFGRLSWALENGDNNTMNVNMRSENVVLLVRKVLIQFNTKLIPIFVKKVSHHKQNKPKLTQIIEWVIEKLFENLNDYY